MAENRKDRQLDALLDSLLSGYSAIEPRPGIEMRVSAHLKAHSDRRRKWMLAFAVSAAMLVLAALVTTMRTEAPGPIARSSPNQAVGAARPGPVLVTRRSARRMPAEAVRSALARKDKTIALIKLANTMHPVNDPGSQDVEPDPAETPQDQTREQDGLDKSGIRNLDVQSLEIKELAPPRSDEKGNL